MKILSLLYLLLCGLPITAVLALEEFQNADYDPEYKRFQLDNPHDPSSSTIKNNVQWRDQQGNLLNIGRGGKIRKIGNEYYWIGHEPAPGPNLQELGGNIYLYKSSNLGSNSWELVKLIYEFDEDEEWTGNCDLAQHPDYVHKYFIICKKLFFMENTDGKPIEEAEFIPVDTPEDPAGEDFTNYNFGNSAAFQDGQNVYYITSRVVDNAPNTRTVLIYLMDQSWKKLEELYVFWKWNAREGMHMVKNGDFYYLFASETKHWRSSRTFYRKARSIKELANASEEEIIVYPQATNNILSHGSQHRMIFEVEPGKWLFSGNRYPDESPSDWDLRFGRAVQAPVIFKPDKVEVYFKREFDWKTYDYLSGDYDTHPRGNAGYISFFNTKVSVKDSNFFDFAGKANLAYCETTGTHMLKKLSGSGFATFTTNVKCSGTYSLHVSYITTEDRYLYVSANGNDVKVFKFGRSGKWCAKGGRSTVRTIQLDLAQGANIVKFQNPEELWMKPPLIEWVALMPNKCNAQVTSSNNDMILRVDDEKNVEITKRAKMMYCKGTRTNMVRNIHSNGHLIFTVDLQCPIVEVEVSYLTNQNRKMYISVNDSSSQIFDFESTGKWCKKGGTSQSKTIPLTNFRQGANTIKFQNLGDDPDTTETNERMRSPFIEWIRIRENCFEN